MSPPTSFQPTDVAASIPTGGDPETADLGAPPRTANLTSDQLSAFGLDGATPGAQFTITVTVGDVSDTGTSVTVDDSAPVEGAGDLGSTDLSDPTALPDDALAPPLPPKPKPGIRGPKAVFGKKP